MSVARVGYREPCASPQIRKDFPIAPDQGIVDRQLDKRVDFLSSRLAVRLSDNAAALIVHGSGAARGVPGVKVVRHASAEAASVISSR